MAAVYFKALVFILLKISSTQVYGQIDESVIDTLSDDSTLASITTCTDCTICGALAASTAEVTCSVSGNCNKPIEELVTFQCLKAKTSNFFVLSLANPSISTLFDFSLPFGILTHGFTDSFPGKVLINNQGWISKTAVDWAANGINVCAVDWGTLSDDNHNYFFVSQNNTHLVADYVVQLIQTLEKNGAVVSQTSLAGHSLGAHISGKVGSSLKKQGKIIQNIYGLDPAGPCYTFPCNVCLDDRLDKSDANKVQIVHTNIGVYGQIAADGCEDFYLNWGIIQPGATYPLDAHYFATKIFDYTLDKTKICTAFQSVERIGIHGQGVCGEYHVDTNQAEPYCPKTALI